MRWAVAGKRLEFFKRCGGRGGQPDVAVGLTAAKRTPFPRTWEGRARARLAPHSPPDPPGPATGTRASTLHPTPSPSFSPPPLSSQPPPLWPTALQVSVGNMCLPSAHRRQRHRHLLPSQPNCALRRARGSTPTQSSLLLFPPPLDPARRPRLPPLLLLPHASSSSPSPSLDPLRRRPPLLGPPRRRRRRDGRQHEARHQHAARRGRGRGSHPASQLGRQPIGGRQPRRRGERRVEQKQQGPRSLQDPQPRREPPVERRRCGGPCRPREHERPDRGRRRQGRARE